MASARRAVDAPAARRSGASGRPEVVHLIKAAGLAGAERHLLTLLPGLDEVGFAVRLIVLSEPAAPIDDLVRAFQGRRVAIEQLKIRRDVDPLLLVALGRRLRTLAPAILHTHLVHADLYGAWAARLLGTRGHLCARHQGQTPLLVSTRHDRLAFRRRWWMRGLHRAHWRQLSAGICVSDALAAFCTEVEGAPPHRIERIPHGLRYPDPDRERARARLGLGSDDIAVGMAGRLVPEKGFDLGLDAFARVATAHPAAQLVVLGDGPERRALEARAAYHPVLSAADEGGAGTATRALGAEPCQAPVGRVRWLGWRPDAGELLAGLDLLMAPSRSEGFGLVLLEAMAQGVPVVATQVDAIPEVVTDYREGRLALPGDVDGLAAALDALITDAALRARLGSQARVRARGEFTAQRMIQRTAALYDRLLEDTW